MGKMKANRKFKNEEEAVSAVIGVILMVAITVAIAATVYVYVSGMLTGGSQKTPDIAFIMDDANDRLTVTKVSVTNIPWDTTNMVISGAITLADLYDDDGFVTAGDYFANCTGVITISYQGVALLGTWTFS